MILSVSVAAAVMAGGSLVSPECAHFPGAYFDLHAKATLQRRAMERWPGPPQLVSRWQAGELDDREKMAVLLGASAFHDPVMLPLYREAVMGNDPRLRMAAAYGYRELLGDVPPSIAGGVDDVAAKGLANEIDAVAATLRTRPLVELWLQSALDSEGRTMPGWRGLVLKRPAGICFRAVEQIMIFDDYRYVMIAFRISEETANRAALLRLLEAVCLKRFYVKPSGARAGWGREDLDEALAAADLYVDYWMDQRCANDATWMIRASFTEMGAAGADPWSITSYYEWLQLLRRGAPSWRMMVARQLYLFGAPWSQLTVFRAQSSAETESWQKLLDWFGPRPGRPAGSGRPDPSAPR